MSLRGPSVDVADHYCGVGSPAAAAAAVPGAVVAGDRPLVDAQEATHRLHRRLPERRKALRRRVCGSQPRLGVTAAHRLGEKRRHLRDDVSA